MSKKKNSSSGSRAPKTEAKEADLARLAAIVQSSEDAIYAVDLDGVITNWNQAAEYLYGYTAQEIIGQTLIMLIPPECREREKGILERLLHGERVKSYETLRLRKDGSVVNVSMTVSPIENAQGEVIGTSRIARDITDRKRAEEQIRAAYERESAARGGRTRQPPQGRIPCVPLARAALAAPRHPRMVEDVDGQTARRRDLGPHARSHIQERSRAEPAGQRTAGRLAHHHG
jgi:PAS domain S-box-containing protein